MSDAIKLILCIAAGILVAEPLRQLIIFVAGKL